MNLRRRLTFLFALVAALICRGAEANKGDVPEWAELFGGASLPVVWQSALAASDKIAATLEGNQLSGVAEWAETIHLASHALADQVKLEDPERARRLKAALDQAARIADDVLDAANHKEPDKAAEALRRLRSALALARLRLPQAILDAPAQEVRTVKASGRPADQKTGPGQKK